MTTLPRKLYVELATLCNLGCAMCVKHSAGWNCAEGLMSRTIFEALAPVFSGLETLNLNGVGESLLHPELPELIAFARARVAPHCRIGFQSNGMLLTAPLAARLVDAGLDRICFSVDSPDADQLKAFRAGAELQAIGNAFALMEGACARPGARSVDIGAETVLSARNFEALPAMVDWCAQHGASFMLVSNVLPYRSVDAGQSLYTPVSRRCLDFFTAWRSIFAAEGLDIASAYRAHLSVVRSPEQIRQIELLRAMFAEARELELQFSMTRIMDVDWELLKRVQEVLARSSERAERLGLRLQLPELVAREPRRCPFVDEPSLFVAHDGALSPCYYLWHSYSTWIGGEELAVPQTVFGNVPDDNLLEVWNSPDFLRFRDEARREEYARCGDCGVTPCDYLSGFAAPQVWDCYGAFVKCGSCPWSGGGFACLQ